jgi:hypothetical protein
MTKNWNCDGGRCKRPDGVVKVYPLGGGANLILCRSCFLRENAYRAMRARETGEPANWPKVEWDTAEEYAP